MARPDFRAAAARRLSEDRELPPAIVSLLSPETTHPSTGVKMVPVDRIEPNPEQPRLAFDEATLDRARRVHPRARGPPTHPAPPHRRWPVPAHRRRAPLAGLEDRRAARDPRAGRGHRRRHRARDLDHREPPARGHLAARRGGDVRPDDPRARVQHPQARREARQGQGLPREPAPARRRAARGPRARVFAQGHPVARLRADEGRGPEEAHAGWPTRLLATSCRWSSSARRSRAGPPGPPSTPRRPARSRRSRRPSRPRTRAAGTAGTGSGSPSPTTAWSPPSSSSTRPSRSCSASSATRTSSTRSARPTGPTSPST